MSNSLFSALTFRFLSAADIVDLWIVPYILELEYSEQKSDGNKEDRHDKT